MTDEIHKLMKQQLLAANDLRISEFKALQSQINPHFLYNTLDMIKWMAKAGKSEEVSDAVQMLSRFYKLTLNKGNITVAVKEELEHVSLYVQLQNMRFFPRHTSPMFTGKESIFKLEWFPATFL